MQARDSKRMSIIYYFFSPPAPIPANYRENFRHLFYDIAWFGILNGSSLSFMSVYATRLGASGFQIGMLGAVPAIMSLALAIPASRYLQRNAIDKAVFRTSVYFRLGYLFWIPLPWLLNEAQQIWALIFIILLMGIPGTALAVGFNALFAEAVPPEWRAYVAGIRNVMLSITFVLTSLIAGWLLDKIPFPLGYQIVFGLGFLGAFMSSYHLYYVRPVLSADATRPATRIGDRARPGMFRILGDSHRPSVGLRLLARDTWRKLLRTDILRSPFLHVLTVLLFFHLGQYLALPLFPIYYVRNMGLSDQQIGIGQAVFYALVLLGSMQLARLSRRYSNKTIFGISAILMGIYPIILVNSSNFTDFIGLSMWGGAVWAMTGGALPNYLLENIPTNDRPAHLAWYNIVFNGAVLAGSLLGPLLADLNGLAEALILFALIRTFAGAIVLKWG